MRLVGLTRYVGDRSCHAILCPAAQRSCQKIGCSSGIAGGGDWITGSGRYIYVFDDRHRETQLFMSQIREWSSMKYSICMKSDLSHPLVSKSLNSDFAAEKWAREWAAAKGT